MAYAADLRKNLSARRETGDAELLKVGETFTGNPEPSLLTEEGVETRRAAPKPQDLRGTVKG